MNTTTAIAANLTPDSNVAIAFIVMKDGSEKAARLSMTPGSDEHVDVAIYEGGTFTVPADYRIRITETVATCAAKVSADCTGEGTAYAGRCLPCDFDLAAHEEMAMMQHAEDIHCAY